MDDDCYLHKGVIIRSSRHVELNVDKQINIPVQFNEIINALTGDISLSFCVNILCGKGLLAGFGCRFVNLNQIVIVEKLTDVTI